MKWQNKHIIWLLACILCFFSCADDEPMEQNVECCVNLAWSNGRGGGTRLLNSLLSPVNKGDLALSKEDYPAEISLTCNGKSYTLTKSDLTACSSHSGYYNGYSCEPELKDTEAKKGVTASATIDGVTESGVVELQDSHLLVTLHHSKALVRFSFKVSAKYDKIRYIKITDIKLNEQPCILADKVLSTDDQFVAYVYLDPVSNVGTSSSIIKCTYNIYDKDEASAEHLTREGVIAQNSFKFSDFMDGSNKVTSLKAGYYYDLNVTLNPDYLYVLSDHDNKHLTIQ